MRAVTDGDTLRVRATGSGRDYDVRLIGLDTPKTKRPGTPIECGGPEATASMARLALLSGRGAAVAKTTDPSQETRDRYGRLLAYITRSDGVDLAQLRGRRLRCTSTTRPSSDSTAPRRPSAPPGADGSGCGAPAAGTFTARADPTG